MSATVQYCIIQYGTVLRCGTGARGVVHYTVAECSGTVRCSTVSSYCPPHCFSTVQKSTVHRIQYCTGIPVLYIIIRMICAVSYGILQYVLDSAPVYGAVQYCMRPVQ